MTPTDPRRSHDQHAVILPMVPPRGMLEEILDEVRASCAARGVPECRTTIDVADRHVLQVDPTTVRAILAGLILSAYENAARAPAASDAPHVREIVITSVEHAASIEIEVADSGPADRGIDGSTLEPLVSAVGGTVSCAACPEGGRAVTLRLPHRRLRRQAA